MNIGTGWMVAASLILVAGCSPEKKDEPPLRAVTFDDAATPYVKRECLPVLNAIIDSLEEKKHDFPELADFEGKPIEQAFDGFHYSRKAENSPVQPRSTGLEPGDCTIFLCLEPFDRTAEKDGAWTSTARYRRIYPQEEFDELAIRLNYNLDLGCPNPDLRALFNGLVKDAIVELRKKDDAYRKRE